MTEEKPWVVNGWAPLGVFGLICWFLLTVAGFMAAFTNLGYFLIEIGAFVLLLAGVSLFGGLRGPVRAIAVLVFLLGALFSGVMVQDNFARFVV